MGPPLLFFWVNPSELCQLHFAVALIQSGLSHNERRHIAMDIFSQPNLQDLLRDYAVHTNRFVFFVGAGLSANAKLPGWGGLRSKLERRHEDDAILLADAETRKRRRGQVRTIRSLPDPWDAFGILKDAMAPSSYHSVIKSELSYSDDAPLPEVIKRIWKLRTYGVVTLNIDTLLSRAFAEVRSLLPQHGVGCALQKKIRLLQSDKQWIINLHGIVDDEETWVFTKEDLAKLFSDEAYKLFMKALFVSNRVVFLGIGADDIAIKRHLDELRKSDILLDAHYWITDRADIKTAEWAASHNIKTIFYPPAGHDHQTPLLRIFDALDGHIERYKAAAPVTPSTPPSNVVLTPQKIKEKSPEEARAILSSYAAKILSSPDKADAENNYEDFLRAYTEAVNHAALIEDFPPYNTVFSCELMPPPIGGGAFGRVYAAHKGGNKLAVKIINNNVRSDRVMLNSFRQGVESLAMIRDANIPGIVEIIDAYEIPPTIIMEYIDGENVEELVTRKVLHPINHGIPLMVKVTDIIRCAHKINVLHRDIRPSNIMVADIHGDIYAERNVVVLDFDLSWHNRGKDYKISENMTTMLGYLAPEQFTDSPSASRKAAEVDVYGLGMTLFYIASGRHPQANERTAATWNAALASISRNRFQTDWHSLGSRLSKLISDATSPDQKKRLDIASFQDRLKLIEKASKWPECSVVDVSLWTEEIAARSFGVEDISWDNDNTIAKLSPLPNWSISLNGREVTKGAKIFISVDYADAGVSQFRTITKYWPNKLAEIKRTLLSVGWHVDDGRTKYSSYSARIFAEIDLDHAITNVKSVCNALRLLREKISSS